MALRRGKKKKWRFFWKNFQGGGRLIHFATGIFMFGVAYMLKEDTLKSALFAGWGLAYFFYGIIKWSPTRAFLKMPSRKAFLRHYPKEAEAA